MNVQAYHVNGGSMWPLLKQGETVFVKEDSSVPGDVILYKRDGRLYVHRLLKKDDYSYIVCGDTAKVKRHSVKEKDIIGKVINIPFWSKGRIGSVYGYLVRSIFKFIWLIR